MEALRADLTGTDGGDGLARRDDDVVLLGLGERRHVLREDLGDAADLGAHDVETARGGLDDDGAKGFREGRVEVDVAARHDVPDVLVADGAQHLDAVLQHVRLNHLLQVDGLGAGAGDDEARVGVALEDAGDGGGEEVGALVVEEAGYDDDGDHVAGAEADGRDLGDEVAPGRLGRVGGVVAGAEVFGDDGVGDDGDHEGVEGGAQDGVLLAGVADAYAVVYVAEGELEHLVGEDAGGVGEAEERVVGEDGAQAHGAGVEDPLVAEAAQAAVAVDDLDALADADVAEDGEEGEDGGKGGLAVDDEEGHVVDLEAVGQVADALAVVVGVGDDDDLVPTVDELGRDLVDVRLYASGLGEEEVADHGDVVRSSSHCENGVWTSLVPSSHGISSQLAACGGEEGEGEGGCAERSDCCYIAVPFCFPRCREREACGNGGEAKGDQRGIRLGLLDSRGCTEYYGVPGG